MRLSRLSLCLAAAALSACGAPRTDVTVMQAQHVALRASPPSIPCARDPAIDFHAAKPGQQDDRANAYDTPETIDQIVKHNAVRKAVCP